MLIGDHFGTALVYGVVVTGDECLVITESNLLLAEVALALDTFAIHAGSIHRVADVSKQRFNTGRGEQVVVHVVVGGGAQVVVPLGPGFAVGVVKDDEFKLSAHEGDQAMFG